MWHVGKWKKVGSDKHLCLLCSPPVEVASGNTTNLKSHLQKYHSEQFASPPQNTLDNFLVAFTTPEDAKRAIEEFIYMGNQSFAIVENPHFQNLLRTFLLLPPSTKFPLQTTKTHKTNYHRVI